MKNFPSPQNIFVIHSGVGVVHYFIRDEGVFQVRFNNQIKNFETLIAAYKFYLPLQFEASIWDMTDGPILVESKILMPADDLQ